ncbi:amino acid ABC transporter substrate-binding protein [Acidihalobacter ferrooxydans]|uniref:Amino acid ABC transporter substrate-binding protein n=1 Tax=Acidihalobacter ferrooxydans TaxID=1765967 RepID=A0A1P8UFV8_9GAMM|nr:amino acid ABC transporter substrate-binding protein [Acidihalobacter ferrooxydans]APZ42699.1 amino acid ABC transporter substrate-binding protein [Acidihalobacter ferrooxydans]
MQIVKIVAAGVAIVGMSVAANAHAGKTFDSVKAKGYVQCGVGTGLPGFSSVDSKGQYTGLDVDVCRAVAAAMFGDANKVRYTPLTAKERFTALQSGEIDILSRNTTWTMTRDTSLGLTFAGVNYYDGQGFLVKKSLGVTSAKELAGATFCIQAGTTTELNLADYMRSHHMKYQAVTFDTSDATSKAFDNGRCDVLTSDQSQLYALRTQLKNPEGAMVLPEVISKEPLGPVVRSDDTQWFNLVKWSLFAMKNAEWLGVTSKNVAEMKKSNNPNIQRLLGTSGEFGKMIGVSNAWAYDIISQVGNYGESFERNVGMESPLKIKRGLNALWTQGGIQYAPPIR